MSLNKFIKSLESGEILLPELRDYMVNRVKQEEAGKLSRKDITVTDAKMTIIWAKDRIEEFNHGEEIPGEYFHPSALGVCQRKLFFEIKHAPKDTKKNDVDNGTELLKSHLTFETGTHIHLIIQNLCQLAGILVQREVAIQDEKRKILGHCDGVLKIGHEKYVLEIKSTNSAGFIKKTAPDHAHKAQTHAYLRCLGIKKGIVLYVNKDNGQMKEFLVEYSHDFFLTAVRNRIRRFFSKMNRCVLPDREGNNPKGFPCMFCQHTRVCFETGYSERWMREMSKKDKAKKF